MLIESGAPSLTERARSIVPLKAINVLCCWTFHRRNRSLLLLLVALLAAGCAGPAAVGETERRAIAGRVGGSWSGIMTGRELALAAHIIDVPVRLSIYADGTWELTSILGDSSGVITSLVDDELELDGRLGHARGPAVWYRVRLDRQGTLMGLAHTHFLGRTVLTGIVLRRVSREPPPR